MHLVERIHMMHRFWRYRISTEQDSLKFILSLPLAGKTVLDIGANKGIYTYWLSKKVGFNGEVIALEPQPELVTHLNHLKVSFHLENVTIVPFAASNFNEPQTLYRKYPGHGGASFLPESNREKIKINTTVLDDLYGADLSDVALIKCDVEGHELEALKGAKKILEKFHPILVVEVHHQFALKGELFEYLEKLGYEGSFIQKGVNYPLAKWDQMKYLRNDTHRNYIFRKSIK